MSEHTIATFRNIALAEIVRGRLSTEGLSAHLNDVYVVGVNWLWSDAIGGVKLKLDEEDLSEAAEVLSALGPYELPDEEQETLLNSSPSCPKCASLAVSAYRPIIILSALISFGVLGGPLLLMLAVSWGMRRMKWNAEWRCLDCGSRW